MNIKTIGIVGGVGPKAGTDLANKIITNTHANIDQEHIPMILVSYPHKILDRTEFLQGKHLENPAEVIYNLICQLKLSGADIVAVPCNTLHATPIMNVLSQKLIENNIEIVFINMIESVAKFIRQYFPNVNRIGLLATLGTYQHSIYPNVFQDFGLKTILPELSEQQVIHQAIYDKKYGIKSASTNLNQAKSILDHAGLNLINLGAEVIVMGCSEIPLVFHQKTFHNIPLIDPTDILARQLIEKVDPKKLLPYKI